MTTSQQPAWFTAAIKEIGTREIPENRGPAIRRYIKLGHCGSEGDPWCAIFANAMLESVGVPGTRSAMARSFEHDQHFVKLSGPALGCIVTFWRGVKSRGFGHVGFYAGEAGDDLATLGGNESDTRVLPCPRGWSQSPVLRLTTGRRGRFPKAATRGDIDQRYQDRRARGWLDD